jgi:nicotinamide-nucleotide amidase
MNEGTVKGTLLAGSAGATVPCSTLPAMADGLAGRPLHAAEVLSIGSELTVGETRDTNAGELARSLTEAGLRVGRMTALPDNLPAVSEAFGLALARSDVVVSTGGLGPTPDDLTREAIAATIRESPVVDPALEAWLRDLWARRGMAFPEINLKQAWVLPSVTVIPNANGTAPGWWVDRPDGRVIVALPGPPREMRPMWREWVLPRLREHGPGPQAVTKTYRLAGIGESVVADRLGEPLLRAANPIVATYARADAVDVRISAVAQDGRTAEEIVADAEAAVLDALGGHVWARGETTWPEAIGDRLTELGWTLATLEIGTGGALTALLGDMAGLRRAESIGANEPGGAFARADDGDGAGTGDGRAALDRAAEAARATAGTEVGLAVRIRARGDDTAVSVAIIDPDGTHRESRMAFLGGSQGRTRAALTAAAILLERLRTVGGDRATAAGRATGVERPERA